MATIIETLQNAEFNIRNNNMLVLNLALEQIRNARILLEKGYAPQEEIEPLLERFGSIDDVPPNE